MKQPDTRRRFLLLIPVVTLAASSSLAQQAPPAGATTAAPTPAASTPAAPAREVPRPDQLEPGVDTSAAPPSSATSTQTKAGAQPAASNATPPAPRSKKGSKPGAPEAHENGGKPAQDRIELDTTQITGNRELPKVLYIVPWKRSDLGDLVGKPPNSLLDEVLSPVDRDVFKRENRYYDALKPDAAAPAGAATSPAPAAGAAPPSGGKP